MSFVDREAVEALRRSLDKVGQIYSIIVDEQGEIISGRHRALAGAGRKAVINLQEAARRLGVSREATKVIYRMHSNVQRQVSAEETKALLLTLAREFEEQGVPKEKIASELVKWAPYSDRYIRDLLPEEYKLVEKRSKSSQELSEEEKIWLASTIDSTGSIYQDKNGQLWIKVYSTDRDLVEKAAETIGGSVAEEKRDGKKTLYETTRHGAESVTALLKQIQPYLKDKKDVAQRVLGGTAEPAPVYHRKEQAESPNIPTEEMKQSSAFIQQPSTIQQQEPFQAQQTSTIQPQQSHINPASEVVHMIETGVKDGLFTWSNVLAAMDVDMTLQLAAAYRSTLAKGSRCPVCGQIIGSDDPLPMMLRSFEAMERRSNY